MGNKIARTTQISASEYYLQELPSSYNLVLMEVVGRGRFLKSILCKHDEGLVIVKVYFKRGDSVDLRDHVKRLEDIKQRLKNVQHSHVWPFQCWFETDKAAYLLRQYFYSNLHDRLSTRPFLSTIEKKWLAFQLLYALKQIHENGVCHGDIKCENVLVTSWNWVYLADFASFKPTYLPDDDPSDFSFYFDTGGRRRCYLAPERFYDPGSEAQLSGSAMLKPSMDVFSLGCVIAELFLEGQPLFELSQLLAYRRGQYDPKPHLNKISDVGVRNMILHMIQLNPEERLSCDNYLQSYAPEIFPSYFSPLLHNFFSCLMPLDTDTRVAVTQNAFPEILKHMTTTFSDKSGKNNEKKIISIKPNELATSAVRKKGSGFSSNLKDSSKKSGQPDKSATPESYAQLITDINDLKKEIDKQNISQRNKYFPGVTKVDNIFRKNESSFRKDNSENRYLCSPHNIKKSLPEGGMEDDSEDTALQLSNNSECSSSEGMVLIASFLCACVRSVTVAQSRRSAILLLLYSSYYIDDDDRLQHVLPYVVALLSDPSAIVRCAALQTVCDVLSLVNVFPPSDAKIFPEYILPMLSTLPDDPEESVRICYADNMYKIAVTAMRFLLHSQELTRLNPLEKSKISDRVINGICSPSQSKRSQTTMAQLNNTGEAELTQLRQSIAHVIQELAILKQTPNIRRALLKHIEELCQFFGEQHCNDFLLPNLTAFLNDRDEQLRSVFFEQIIHVCSFVGKVSVEKFLLPCIEQALLVDVEEVIVNALKCLSDLTRMNFLRKRLLLSAVEKAAPLLCHPSHWVRRTAVTFIAASSENLHQVDSRVYLLPMLQPFLRREPASLSSEIGLHSCLKPPMSRKVFDEVLEKFMNFQSSKGLSKDQNQSKTTQVEEIPKTAEVSSVPSQHNGVSKEDSVNISGRNSALAKSCPDKTKAIGISIPAISIDEAEDAIKMKAMESYILSLSSTMQTRDHNRELEISKKFQSSPVAGMHSPTGVAVSSSYNPSYEGVPVYVYPVSEKKAEKGLSQRGMNVNEEWNQESGGYQGTGSSTSSQRNAGATGHSSLPNSEFAHKPVNMTSSLQPKFFTSPLLNSSVTSAKQNNKLIKESSVKDNISMTNRINQPNEALLTDINSKVNPTTADQIASTISLASDSAWRPRGVLVAHLQEHQLAVNDLAVSSDQCFFVTASDDGTAKIWDSRRLEKDISFRSRLTYNINNGRALRVMMFSSGSLGAVGTSTGSVRVFSINYSKHGGVNTERYSGLSDVDKKETQEGAVLSLQSFGIEGPSMILYSTQLNGIHLWDLRARKEPWSLKANPEEGYITSVVLGPCQNWLISGSSAGVLTLWDLRFLIPVNTWQYPSRTPIEKMCLYAPGSNVSSSRAGSYVYVAAGFNEMALCNVKDGSYQRIFRTATFGTSTDVTASHVKPSSQLPPILEATNNSKQNVHSKSRVQELNDPPPRIPGIWAVLPLRGGDILTAGTDMKIRMWDNTSPDRSYCVCGPALKNKGGEFYSVKPVHGVQVVQEEYKNPEASKMTSKAYLSAAATDSAGCHRDCILSMASVNLNQRLLISSSRNGEVKVWK